MERFPIRVTLLANAGVLIRYRGVSLLLDGIFGQKDNPFSPLPEGCREAMLRGAQVTLVSGPVDLPLVPFVETRPVTTAADMFRAVRDLLPATDVLIKAAAVADYRPAQVASDKMKKSDQDLSIPLERTDDILGWVAEHRHPGLFVCGFSMETRDMVANSRAKLERKKLDMIVANNLKVAGAGFGTKTNVVTLITREGERELPLMGKDQVAAHLLDEIQRRR